MVVPPYIYGCQEIFWTPVTKLIWYADHTNSLAVDITHSARSFVSAWTKAAGSLEAWKNELARLITTEMRKYRSRVDEAVKCRRVCRYCAENAQCFLANEWSTTASKSYLQYQALGVILVVMPWNYPIIGWCSGSLLRADRGKCRLARAHIERRAVGAESEEVGSGPDYGGSRSGRYHRHRPKRFIVWRRLPMKPRGVSSRRLSLRHWR
jgi:hypothetical protein